MLSRTNEIEKIVIHQLRNYFLDIDEVNIERMIPQALSEIEKNFWGIPDKKFFDSEVIFSPMVSIHWMIFLYRLSRIAYLQKENLIADQVYYLNKIMHSIDWFYAVDLPDHFMCEHPLGSVLGRATYGDYFFIYQGTTVGGSWKKGNLIYPKLGHHVVLYSNSTILGDSVLGDNVIVASGTYLINEKIPSNCIVFGKSPNITIKKRSEEEISQYLNQTWGGELKKGSLQK